MLMFAMIFRREIIASWRRFGGFSASWSTPSMDIRGTPTDGFSNQVVHKFDQGRIAGCFRFGPAFVAGIKRARLSRRQGLRRSAEFAVMAFNGPAQFGRSREHGCDLESEQMRQCIGAIGFARINERDAQRASCPAQGQQLVPHCQFPRHKPKDVGGGTRLGEVGEFEVQPFRERALHTTDFRNLGLRRDRSPGQRQQWLGDGGWGGHRTCQPAGCGQRRLTRNSAFDFVFLSRVMCISIDSMGPRPCMARRRP
jgi:hypothetical protein